jgi:hypothetical protein
MAAKVYYEIWVKAPDIGFSVAVNDVGLHTDRFQAFSEWSQTVNQWMIRGENSCRLLIYAGPLQEEGFTAETACRIEFREITATPEGATTKVLAAGDWRYEPDCEWPQKVDLLVTIDPPFPDWEWTRADILREDDLKDPALKAYVENLLQVLDAKDFAALKPLLDTKARELALAYQIPIEVRQKDQEDFFQEFFADPKWGMQPIDWNTLVHDFHAHGRVLELMSAEGKPLLASDDLAGDANFRLGIYLYRSRGVWKLAR